MAQLQGPRKKGGVLAGVSRAAETASLFISREPVSPMKLAILGAGLAWLAGAATNSYYQRFFDTDLIFSLITPRIVLFSLGLSLVLGIGAGALAAWRLVRTPPMVLWGRA